MQPRQRRPGGQPARIRLPQHEQANSIRAALLGGASASSGSLTALQRAVGNRGTTLVVRREVDLSEGVGKTADVVDASSGVIGYGSSLGGLQTGVSGNSGMAYQYGNTNTPGAEGGTSASLLTGLTSAYALVNSSRSAREADQAKGKFLKGRVAEEEARTGPLTKEERKRVEDATKKEATYRDAQRGWKSGTANALQASGNIAASGLNATSGISQVMANAGSQAAFAGMNNLLGGIGAIVAAPVQIAITVRTCVKAHKQNERAKALAAIWTDPKLTAEHAKNKFDELTQLLDAQRGTCAALREAYQNLIAQPDKTQAGYLARKAELEGACAYHEAQLLKLETDVATAARVRDEAAKAVDEAGKRKEKGEETPDDIRAYALTKNQRGFIKKVVSAIGGLLGIGGGIAGTVAAFAAVGATGVVTLAAAATPVGWALCGAGALIGLALGGYALTRWATKRYKHLRKEEFDPATGQTKQMSKGKAFLTAINPFKKVGNNERGHMAERLYLFARGKIGTAPDHAHAQETLVALGLKPDELNINDDRQRETVIKLIKEKMAS